MAKSASRTVFQLKVTLQHLRPPVWRRLLVSSTMKLSDFHRTLQATMGWSDYHLHQFSVGSKNFAIPDPECVNELVLDERQFKISDVLQSERDSLLYEYDFGDGWEHLVLLEKVLPYDLSLAMPKCLKGKRACPPEDVGGPWGYEEFLKAIRDSGHPEHDAMLEWVGGGFDAEAFDVAVVNQMLSEEFWKN